jgi:hypothetical protein
VTARVEQSGRGRQWGKTPIRGMPDSPLSRMPAHGERDVFAAARRLAAAFSPDCHATVADAIGSHAGSA